MPKYIRLLDKKALVGAMKSPEGIKALLSNKENAKILLSSATARKAFIDELVATGKDKLEIQRILGQIASELSSIKWS